MSFRYRHGDRPLEGYTILRGIGRGGFGEVYYALSDGGREVALKVVQQNDDIELRGIQHCINLKSPYLVSIFDVKRNADGLPFVVMEYVSGPNIRDLLRDSPRGLGSVKAAFIVREIARGLTCLHDRGIVHRDLKPENIFCEDGSIKIGDYGLSKYIAASRQSMQTISVGTVHYMAPEIGSGNYHRGIDVYALGVILYELLTGTVPFNGDSMGEILLKHLSSEPDLSPINAPLRPVLAKALMKDPRERFATARELADSLLAVDGLAARVDGFQPTSLSAGARVESRVEAPLLEGAAAWNPAPERERLPDRPAVTPAPAAAVAPAPLAAAPPRDLEHRIAHGLVTALAMSLGMNLLAGGRAGSIWGSMVLTLACASAICLVETWWAPRFQVGVGIGRRLATFGVTLPVYLLASGLFPPARQLIPVFCVGLLLLDWNVRTRAERKERVSFHLAFTAAVCGFVTALISEASPLLGAGTLASLSLVSGALAFHAPLSAPKSRSRASQAKLAAGAASPSPAARAAKTPPLPPIPISAEAPFRAEPNSDRRRLLRPRQDRALFGVASGLAQYFGWEVTWLRVAFLLATIAGFGTGIVVYLAFAICMPAEPKPAPLPRVGGSRWVARTGLALLGAAFLALPIFLLFSFKAMPHSGFEVPGRAQGVAQAVSSGRVSFAFLGICGMGVSFLLGAIFLRRRPSRAASLAASAETVPLPGKLTPGPRRPSAVSVPPPPTTGWTTLGVFFFVLALVPLAVGTLSQAGLLTPEVLGLSPRDTGPLPWIEQFSREGGHFLLSALFFLPAVSSLLIARRRGGASHVLRGALGLTAAGAFLVILSILLVGILRPEGRQSPGQVTGVFHGLKVQPVGLVFLLSLGTVGALCLAWPERGAAKIIDVEESALPTLEPGAEERWPGNAVT